MALRTRDREENTNRPVAGVTLVPAFSIVRSMVRAAPVYLMAVAVGSAAWLASPTARVHAQPNALVGTYQASAATIRSEVSAWGADCGVQPQSYVAKERPLVSITTMGAHLVLTYPDRRLRTDLCWSPNPLVKLASATAADNRWRAECRTPRGEAKQEVGRYTVTATGPYTLELAEESDYDWQLKGSHCVASVRISQQLERVPQERAAEPAPETKPGPDVKALATPPCVPGAVTRLRIRPAEARIEPGQRVCFSVQGMDAKGCATDVEMTGVRWELKKPDAARAQLADGCFRAAASAADAEGSFRVSALHAGLRAEAAVSVLAPDLSDITARRVAAPASTTPAAPGQGTAQGMEESRVQAAAVKRPDRTVVWLALGAVALALLAGGLFVVLRLRKKPQTSARKGSVPASAPRDPVSRPPTPAPSAPTPAPVTQPETAPRPAPVAVPAPAVVATGPGEQMICPTCRRGYAPGAQRCEGDGSALVPYAEFVRRAKEAETTSTACPSCGAKVAAASVFCGGCGRKLTS